MVISKRIEAQLAAKKAQLKKVTNELTVAVLKGERGGSRCAG